MPGFLARRAVGLPYGFLDDAMDISGRASWMSVHGSLLPQGKEVDEDG
jgi:hypothetical protein